MCLAWQVSAASHGAGAAERTGGGGDCVEGSDQDGSQES